MNATKGMLKQEQKVFGDIANARAHYDNSKGSERVGAANQLEGALSRLMVIVENYPDLKSNQTIASMMVELAGTENRISVARQRYNEGTNNYNVAIKTFPRSVLASFFGFKEKPLFKSEEGANKAVNTSLE